MNCMSTVGGIGIWVMFGFTTNFGLAFSLVLMFIIKVLVEVAEPSNAKFKCNNQMFTVDEKSQNPKPKTMK